MFQSTVSQRCMDQKLNENYVINKSFNRITNIYILTAT